MNEETEQILIGSLLGDGYLFFADRSKNASFREDHSLKQKDYLLWKRNFLEDFDPIMKTRERFDSRTNRHYYQVGLRTKVHPLLTEYYRLFYPNGKKVLTNKIIMDKIKPLALAVWYCDDGCFNYTYWDGTIATCISYDDNAFLSEELEKKFGIKCAIHRSGKNYQLYLGVKEIDKFLGLIKDYVPKCMSYKLGLLVEENIEKLEERRAIKREKDRISYKKRMSDPEKRKLFYIQHKKALQKRLQNPEYKKRYNEYQKLQKRKQHERKKQSNLS